MTRTAHIHAILAKSRLIAAIWGTDDVRLIRPDLTEKQAWQVLQAVDRGHNATVGINWDVLADQADLLFGPATDEAEGA